MTKQEIETILKAAGQGSVENAAAKFLGVDPDDDGSAAAVAAVVAEVAQWKASSADTRAEIDAYKAANLPKKKK